MRQTCKIKIDLTAQTEMPDCCKCKKPLVKVGDKRKNGSKYPKYWHNKMHYDCWQSRGGDCPQEFKDAIWADLLKNRIEQVRLGELDIIDGMGI